MSITSEAKRCRMTRLTCSMSSEMGASRLAALGEEVAVDDMIKKLGGAADYKGLWGFQRRLPPLGVVRAREAPARGRVDSGQQGAGRGESLPGTRITCGGLGGGEATLQSGAAKRFDCAANSMYNHAFSRTVRGERRKKARKKQANKLSAGGEGRRR